MPVGPGRIGPGAFRGGQQLARVAVPRRERPGVDHIAGRQHEILGRHVGQLQDLTGVPLLQAPLALLRTAARLVRRVVDTEQLRGLVEQRDVGHRPCVGGAWTKQCSTFIQIETRSGGAEGTFLGQQRGDQPLRG